MVFYRVVRPTAGKTIARARLYATAMGLYDFTINGERVSEYYFAPGFTSYKTNLQYQTYDVTDYLRQSNEARLEATVTGGWAVGSFVFTRENRVSAQRQALLAELRIDYSDGSTDIIGTDSSWQVTIDSPVRSADLYDGEVYDARVQLDAASWRAASIEKLRIHPQIRADYSARVCEHEVLSHSS